MLTILAEKNSQTYVFGTSENEFEDARMIAAALTTGGYSRAWVEPGTRPAREAQAVTDEERTAMARLDVGVASTA